MLRDFRDNANSITNIANLTGIGNDAAAALSTLGPTSANDVEQALRTVENAQAASNANNENLGIASGSVVGITGKLEHFNKTQREALLQRERAKDKSSDLFLLDLINRGEFGEYLGDKIFGGMSDEEIRDVVADIEAKTGMTFDDYASEVLGDDMPKRVPGQSDEDYQRRVLKVITDQMIGPDGKVKAKYDDDPVADIIKGDKDYKRAVNITRDADAEAKLEGETEELTTRIADAALVDGASADAIEDATENEVFRTVAQNVRHEQFDSEADGNEATNLTSNFFDSFGPAPPMKQASAAALKEFNTVNSPEATGTPQAAPDVPSQDVVKAPSADI